MNKISNANLVYTKQNFAALLLLKLGFCKILINRRHLLINMQTVDACMPMNGKWKDGKETSCSYIKYNNRFR